MAKGGKDMKNKMFLALGALSLICCLNGNSTYAQDEEPIIVCHFEENDDGEIIEICEEIKPSTYELCSPECWDI